MADYYKRGLKIEFDKMPKYVDDGVTSYRGKDDKGLPKSLPVNITEPTFSKGGRVTGATHYASKVIK